MKFLKDGKPNLENETGESWDCWHDEYTPLPYPESIAKLYETNPQCKELLKTIDLKAKTTQIRHELRKIVNNLRTITNIVEDLL